MTITRKLSGSGQEVERGGGSWAEVDCDTLSVVRVYRNRGAGKDCVHSNRAALGFVNSGATGDDAVGVELEGCTTLVALEHVLNHAVGDGKVVVRHVDVAGTSAVAKAGDVVPEGDILTGGLPDGGHVDLSAADVEGPVADLADNREIRVVSLEFVGAYGSTLRGDRDDATAKGGGNSQDTSSCYVTDHVVQGAGGDTSGKSTGDSATGQVDDAELDGIAYFEVVVGADV